MYKVGICDDGISICSRIEEFIIKYAEEHKLKIDIYIWYTGEGIIENLRNDMQLDILFLDIELLKISGIEVGNYIRNNLENRDMQIIYISGKDFYAKELFKTQPMDFIIKPITIGKIYASMDLAIKIVNKRNARYIIQQGKEYVFIPMGEIRYIMSQGRKVEVVIEDCTYKFYGKLSDEYKKLTEDFIIIHKSYIINKKYIKKYTYEVIQMTDNSIFTISKIHRKKVRNKLLKDMIND